MPSSSRATAHRTAARPDQPSGAATGPGSRRSAGTASATSPPAASSQARVGSEKNAHGWDTLVSTTDRASEPPATIASAAAARGRDRERAATTSSSSGQSR